MGTSISIIILALYIYPASILLLYQHINYNLDENKEIQSKLHSIVLLTLW